MLYILTFITFFFTRVRVQYMGAGGGGAFMIKKTAQQTDEAVSKWVEMTCEMVQIIASVTAFANQSSYPTTD